jgi:hypothetical protein
LTTLSLAMVKGNEGKRLAAQWPPVRPATLNWDLATLLHMLLYGKKRDMFRAVMMRQ